MWYQIIDNGHFRPEFSLLKALNITIGGGAIEFQDLYDGMVKGKSVEWTMIHLMY